MYHLDFIGSGIFLIFILKLFGCAMLHNEYPLTINYGTLRYPLIMVLYGTYLLWYFTYRRFYEPQTTAYMNFIFVL